LGAQNFATQQLEYWSGLLKCPLPQQTDTFRCPKIRTLPLVVEYDKAGTVCHLGIRLFPNSLKNISLTKLLYDFQERLFLEVFLQDNEADARQLLKWYKVQYLDRSSLLGEGTFFQSLEKSLCLTAHKDVEYRMSKDSLQWESQWQTADGSNFVLRFPANYDLISGLDTKEAGIWFCEQIRNFKGELLPPSAISPIIDNMEQLGQSLYVRRGKELFVRNINSNLYFNFRLIYDHNYPEESIANLFNYPDPQRSGGLDLQIRHDGESYRVKLSDFQCFMADDYDVFTGIAKYAADNVSISVFYKSKYYNHYHLLCVQTTPEALFNKTEALQAIFYTFIPNQNIKNLYEEYIPKQTKYQITK
jgi:hypothetical protein